MLTFGYTKDAIAFVCFFIFAMLIYKEIFSFTTLALLCVMCGIIDGVFTMIPWLHNQKISSSLKKEI